MTFRETDSVTAIETGQFRGGSTEPKRRGRQPQVPSKGANPPVDHELDRVVDTAVELDETPALSEEALRPSASPAEDPVRLYLKEIGKVSLLKAEEEVTIGRILSMPFRRQRDDWSGAGGEQIDRPHSGDESELAP